MHRTALAVLALAIFVAVYYAACTPSQPNYEEPAPRPPVAQEQADTTRRTNGILTIEPPPSFQADGIRVATFNTEFMFDGEGDEGQADFPHKGDPAKARAHRDRIGRIIRTLQADVVMLQEVENERVMQMLVDESLSDMGYRVYFVQGKDTFTGQDVGVLSRIPVEGVGRTDERAPVGSTSETYAVSKNLWARLDIGGQPSTLINVHFLSRPDDQQRKPQREAQAEVIRRLVAQELQAGRAVAVLGDLNDFDESIPDRKSSRPISGVLQLIKSAGPGATDDLRNVMAEAPQPQRFTNFWDRNNNGTVEEGELSAIDHILLSPALHRRMREVRYVHSHDPAETPDHFPIVVTLSRN